VLLIHAFPVDASMWDRQVETLRSAGWVVVAPSLPGFGATEPVGSVMTMGAAADRCLQALDAAGVERAIVCGLSMGGYAAFELWRMARQRIAGLLLANTRSGADAPEAAEARRALATRLRSEGTGFLVASPPPLLAAEPGTGAWSAVQAWIADQPAASIAAAAEGMAERPDSTPDLGTIDVPTTVVTSDSDTLIPPEVTLEIADHVRDAERVVLGGAGHLSNLETPDVFDDAMVSFLARFRRV
jgi:3-oxoadipate enol-lactonase